MAGTILELKDACYSYRTRAQTVNAVSHVSQAFEAGLFYAVMGRSGSGKTTLLSLLAGLELPDAGEVLYRDKSTAALDCDAYRRDHAAVIYQSYNLFPQLTAEENAAYPLRLRGEGAAAAIEAARSRLLAVGLTSAASPRSSPAASSSAWPSHGPLPPAARSCWPTNPRATSTRPMPRRSWTCSPAWRTRTPAA